MPASLRTTAGASTRRGRFCRLTRVFVTSCLGALVLGAAFWPPYGFERRMIVAVDFDEGLSAEERRQEFDRIEQALSDDRQVAAWSASADAQARPKAFVLAPVAAFAPAAATAEATLSATARETNGDLVGADIRFSDADAIRAERFAQAIASAFQSECDEVRPATIEAKQAPAQPDAVDGAAEVRARAANDAQREREKLERALEDHFEQLRSLRSKLSTTTGATNRAVVSSAVAEPILWQVSPSLSRAEIERRLTELDREIAAKKTAREDLLQKFTSHHPIAAALELGIERLQRERRELEVLLPTSNDEPRTTPRPASATTIDPVPAPPRSIPPRTTQAPSVATPPKAPTSKSPPVSNGVSSSDDADGVAVEQLAAARREAERSAEKKFAAERAELAVALEQALRSEAALHDELRRIAEASQRLADQNATAAVGPSPRQDQSATPALPTMRARVLDEGASGDFAGRFGVLLLVAIGFATAMTAMSWLVGRERAVASADEVRFASGLPVIGQTSPGLLERKPRQNFAAWAVGGTQKLVEGAAFATAVFCVAALAAENPRCLQILRQPLAVAWQALESLT